MKLIAALLAVAVLSGCSTMGSKEDPRAQERELYSSLQQKLNDQKFLAPSFTMDIGYGSTPEEARSDAQKRLASQVIVSVQSVRKSDKSFENGQFSTSQSSAAYSFSSIQLEDARLFDSGLIDNTYYVVVGVDSEMTEKMRREAKRKLPVLSIIERLKGTESSVRKINIAAEGVVEAQKSGVENEQVIVRDIDGEQTFGDYFKHIIASTIADLDIAYEFKGNYTKITFFDKLTFAPVDSGLPIKIGENTFFTDTNGSVLAKDLEPNQGLFLASYEDIFIDSFTLLGDTGKIYVATEPEGAEVEIFEDGELVVNFASPDYFDARYTSDATEYKIVITPEGDYDAYETKVVLKRGYDVFVNQEFAKKTYGQLKIEPKSGFLGTSSVITIEDARGKKLIDRSKDGFEGEAISGRYTITVEDESLDKKYQVVKDEFILRQDRLVEREYTAPIDREYSRGGFGLNWGLRFGRSLSGDTELTLANGTTTADKYNTQANNRSYWSNPYDVTGTTISFYGALEKYTTNLYFGVEAEYLSGGQYEYYSDTSESMHSGFGGAAFAGVYGEIGRNSYWTLGGGYSHMIVSSDDVAPYSYEADISSTFGEARIMFGNAFGISGRIFPETGAMQLGLIFWGADIDESYKYPAKVDARQGTHY